MNTIGQISEINFEIGEIFISEWTLSLNECPVKACNLYVIFLYKIESVTEGYSCHWGIREHSGGGNLKRTRWLQ